MILACILLVSTSAFACGTEEEKEGEELLVCMELMRACVPVRALVALLGVTLKSHSIGVILQACHSSDL